MRYSITELAEEFDISMRALRYYEAEGLLTPERNYNRRIYREADRVRLSIIVGLRAVNFKLDHVKEIVSLFETDKLDKAKSSSFMKYMQMQKDKLSKEADDIATAKRTLDEICSRADAVISELFSSGPGKSDKTNEIDALASIIGALPQSEK